MGFLGGISGKEPACQCRIHNRRRFGPWVGKIPWRREQYSCLENPMDRGAWPGHKESDTTEATEHARMHGIRTQ